MTKIYVIRHAEAEGNIYRRAHGHYNSLVTVNGRRQIEALKERFRDIPIDAVYASDLNRTCETAMALCTPKNLPLHKDSRFREIKMGVWEDKCFGWLEHFDTAQMHYFNHEPTAWRVDGCESYASYTNRLLTALSDVASRHDGQTIAVFTHGAISSATFRLMFGKAAADAGHCDNTGVTLLQYSNGSFSAKYFYDNSHLSPEISTLAKQNWWRGKKDFNFWFRPASVEDRHLYDADYCPQRGHKTFIAMLTERPVGYVSFTLDTAPPSISTLYLLPEWRHLHMGDQLLGCAVCFLRLLRKDSLTVSIPSDNSDALSFFLHHGAQISQRDDMFTVFRMDFAVPPL